MITLTSEERARLAVMVADPDAWMAHACQHSGDDAARGALDAKLARWKSEIDATIASGGPTKAQRDTAEAAKRAEEARAPPPVNAQRIADALIARGILTREELGL